MTGVKMKFGTAFIVYTFLLTGITILVLFGLSCSKKDTMSGGETLSAQEILDDLNNWDREELEVLENPDKFPNRIVSGETNGWVSSHKEELKEFGYSVRWNNDTKLYELESIKE